MVYDCFPFFNELDILKMRLHILDPYVDRFVIEESTVTFSGEPKELVFEKNKALFGEFLPKIDYLVVDNSPVTGTTHERDKFQKNNLMRGLKGLKEEDIIILSDVDEIPNPSVLQEIIAGFDPDMIYHLAQRMFYCFLNMEEASGKLLSITGEFAGTEQKQWLGTKIFSIKNIPATGLIDIREADTGKANSIRVADGGWHFGYMGGQGEKDVARRIGVKVQAAAHQEYNRQDTLAEAADKLILGRDIFGREGEFVRVDIDESFPAYLREHQEEYEYLVMPPISKKQMEYTEKKMKVKRFFRKGLRKAGRIYEKAAKLVTMKQLAVVAVLGFALSLLPEIWLTTVNRAAGDDYGYGEYTRAAWINSHSLIEVGKAAGRTVRQFYYGWQGTWFSIFLFTLQPEVFHEKAYFIVTLLTLTIWIGATSLVLYCLLVKQGGLERSSFVVINILFLLLNMQFIPGIKSSFFWYNGIVHYLLPYSLCLLTVTLLVGYVRTCRWRYYIGIVILLGLLGGSNYQSALFALIVTACFMLGAYWRARKIKYFSLLLPLSVHLFGLMISIKAPGNKIRGGEEFGFSLARGMETIGLSFLMGIRQIGQYLTEKPVAMTGLLLLLAVVIYAQSQVGRKQKEEGTNAGKDATDTKKAAAGEARSSGTYPYPGLFIAIAFCLYCAMQAPELYAGTEVSQGVANINYQTFLLMVLADGVYLGGWLKARGKLKPLQLSRWVIPAVLAFLLFTAVFRSNIKETTIWTCLTYISSGEAADYKEQMEQQTAILLDPSVEDAVLPFINDIQGPLMHMPATENPGAYTNSVMMRFYGKKSVIAMDRTEWNKVYGASWQK